MRFSSLKILPGLATLFVLLDNALLTICGQRAKRRLGSASLPFAVLALLAAALYGAAPRAVIAQDATLSPPTNLSASIGDSGITLSWTAPDGQVDGYEILRRRPRKGENDLATLVDNTGSSDTSYTDTSATEAGERYIYQLKTIRGSDKSDLSLFVQVDRPAPPPATATPTPTSTPTPTATPISVSASCKILAGANHDILSCAVSAEGHTVTSALWTPSFETQYAQQTSRPAAAWVIADEYCGQSTTVDVAAHAGALVLPTASATITLTCAPTPVDSLSVSCENLIENSQHVLSCALSGGDQTITSAQWTPQFDADSAKTTEGANAAEATWDISAEHCGQTTSVSAVPTAGETTLAAVSTNVSLACVIKVDQDCSLANAIRSANGIAQVAESGDSDGNDDCEAGAAPDDSATPPKTGDDIIFMTRNATLKAALPSIASRIHIDGNGRTLSGDGKHRALTVVDGQLGINDLTISNGFSSTVGGGIYVNSGSVSVNDSTIRNSKANDIGGAVYAIDSNVQLVDTEISRNSTEKSHGGGVYFISSTGLHTLDIVGATLKNNTTTEDGGALKTAGGIATITRSAFVNNQADEGGAIESSETTLDISNSTFSSNSAREGGGLSSFSSFVTLTHTTWAYNSAEEQGGGIAIIGWTGNFRIRNSLITDSKSGGDCHSGPNPDIIIDFTGNFIQDGSCAPLSADSQAVSSEIESGQAQALQVISAEAQGSGQSVNPRISGLVGNPPHHPLQWGSPVIDAADPQFCSLGDQPKTARPQYGNCDIGAYEYPRAPEPPPSSSDDDDDDPAATPTATLLPQTPTPTALPEICIVNNRIIVNSPYDDMECEEIDTITLDKHPSLQGIRFAMRLWRYNRECVHVVADGENLFRLALRYDTSMQILRRHNNLATDVLTVGQMLLLPSCQPDAVSFDPGTEVCFEAQGQLSLIDTATPERTIYAMTSYQSDGMTCGLVDRPGIVVLAVNDSG